MFKVGDRIRVESAPYIRRVGQYGTIVEIKDFGLYIAKMDNFENFSDCMKAGHYTLSLGEAHRKWVLAGPRKSNRGFAKFVRKIEEVA